MVPPVVSHRAGVDGPRDDRASTHQRRDRRDRDDRHRRRPDGDRRGPRPRRRPTARRPGRDGAVRARHAHQVRPARRHPQRRRVSLADAGAGDARLHPATRPGAATACRCAATRSAPTAASSPPTCRTSRSTSTTDRSTCRASRSWSGGGTRRSASARPQKDGSAPRPRRHPRLDRRAALLPRAGLRPGAAGCRRTRTAARAGDHLTCGRWCSPSTADPRCCASRRSTRRSPDPTTCSSTSTTPRCNRADVLQRMGLYPDPRRDQPGAPPEIPGLEYAGVVAAVGDRGDRIGASATR